MINFAAIGSGTLHALQSMIGFEHTAKDDLKETVFRVYASKRRAEVAPGVGKDTDLLIVRAGQVEAVGEAVLKELEPSTNLSSVAWTETREATVDRIAAQEAGWGETTSGSSWFANGSGGVIPCG